MKKERGITLVALIITTIVLVILSAISIKAIFEINFIDVAINSTINYAGAQTKEQNEFDALDENLAGVINKVDEYIANGGNSGGTKPEEPEQSEDTKQDGSWNNKKKVNSPKITNTGLIPVYYNGTSWIDLTNTSTDEEWNKWYNYENKEWANARTKDGSMWVWIPRYEYKIDNSTHTIAVNFINTSTKTASSGFTVHPSFTDESGNGYNNGGWNKEIDGFWIAKYPAGFQNGEDGSTNIGTPKYSNLTYQSSGSNTSYAGSTANGIKMSYPVFKANTYAYNCISIGDMYRLSRDIAGATQMYGLNNVDSHLQKNSEWGAVAYLAHSKYGVNGQDAIAQNVRIRNDTPTGVFAVTSARGTVNTSTTQNITGVYDMRGCIHEATASFFRGGNANGTEGMPTDSGSQYMTLYTTNEKKIGDAIMELKDWNHSEGNSWISSINTVFVRGSTSRHDEAYTSIFKYAPWAAYNRGVPFRWVSCYFMCV